ncbi:MAG TPA: Hsp20/alpha crystallin family protein [Chloroflexota bacterium]|jgi:HSP20 family protein|nr:Hsp20/alpha crystallin family protein [Chloroflexota bacterium]
MALRYRRVTYRYTGPGTSLDQFLRRIWELNRQPSWQTGTRWRPPTDVLEGPAGLLVKMELAGVTENDVEVTLFEDVLVVAGQRREEYPEELGCRLYECRYHESGIRYGPFQAEIYLPLPVDAERVTARFENGFLYVTLPRADHHAPRRTS